MEEYDSRHQNEVIQEDINTSVPTQEKVKVGEIRKISGDLPHFVLVIDNDVAGVSGMVRVAPLFQERMFAFFGDVLVSIIGSDSETSRFFAESWNTFIFPAKYLECSAGIVSQEDVDEVLRASSEKFPEPEKGSWKSSFRCSERSMVCEYGQYGAMEALTMI